MRKKKYQKPGTKKVKNEAEINGAKYFIARDFTDFKTWIDKIIENGKDRF